jgi:predicted nucleic acid-binding Zn ribbon protein
MARLLGRLLGSREGEGEGDGAVAAPRDPRPHPGALRRERRALVRAREERIRDLGGLMLEMYRRDRFREDLVQERCLEVIAVEDRLAEVDGLLKAAAEMRSPRTAPRCLCGAPIQWGTHFCANCGRPTGATPVVSCSGCGAAIPADARFCANCGHQVATDSAPVEA